MAVGMKMVLSIGYAVFAELFPNSGKLGLGRRSGEQLLDWSKVWGEWLKAVAKLTNRKTINTVTTAAEESC